MTERDRTRGGGLNTYVDASNGQRVTAIAVGLICSIVVGALCAWLANSVFSGVPVAIQWLLFAVIGAVIGLCLVTLLTRLRAARRR
jgi:uncharacterized membrane protein YeaQ/YmgE (transglycosylase-associated protein family)